MIIGIPKELKDHEERVVLTPESVATLVNRGIEVLVQKNAGAGSGYADRDYQKAGAKLVPGIRELYRRSGLILKVKEPLPQEFRYFRPGLFLFCFLHLAANPRLTRALQKSQVTALGFETLEDEEGHTPLLKPMSEIAGRLSSLLGAHFLRTDQGGKGILLSPTHYSEGGRVTIVGGGNVGRAAAEVASGLGARVQLLDLKPKSLKKWAKHFTNIEVLKSSPLQISKCVKNSDLVIGAVYIPGAKAPQVIRKDMVKAMEPGSVLMDVAVDQGGASETTRPTTLSNPTYLKYGVIHCAVSNLPALVSRTASQILSRTIQPYVLKIAKIGDVKKIMNHPRLASAVNVSGGKIIHPEVLASMKS